VPEAAGEKQRVCKTLELTVLAVPRILIFLTQGQFARVGSLVGFVGVSLGGEVSSQ